VGVFSNKNKSLFNFILERIYSWNNCII